MPRLLTDDEKQQRRERLERSIQREQDRARSTQELIDWFWKHAADMTANEGICQCGTERLINRAGYKGDMRAFLLGAVFIDQLMETGLVRSGYQEFRTSFRFPKLFKHTAGGMQSPSWLVYSNHGYDQKMDWKRAERVIITLVGDMLAFLKGQNGDHAVSQFREASAREISREFKPEVGEQLLAIFLKAEVAEILEQQDDPPQIPKQMKLLDC